MECSTNTSPSVKIHDLPAGIRLNPWLRPQPRTISSNWRELAVCKNLRYAAARAREQAGAAVKETALEFGWKAVAPQENKARRFHAVERQVN